MEIPSLVWSYHITQRTARTTNCPINGFDAILCCRTMLDACGDISTSLPIVDVPISASGSRMCSQIFNQDPILEFFLQSQIATVTLQIHLFILFFIVRTYGLRLESNSLLCLAAKKLESHFYHQTPKLDLVVTKFCHAVAVYARELLVADSFIFHSPTFPLSSTFHCRDTMNSPAIAQKTRN